jgi:hypothetical protein
LLQQLQHIIIESGMGRQLTKEKHTFEGEE